MTDSMKFGPEWIRTLSESGPIGLTTPSSSSHSTSSSASAISSSNHQQSCTAQSLSVRYTLAEHRYGREEMLALYNGSFNPPDNLKSLTGLYVEKSQQPLALFSFTDDELRIWNRGVNPDGLGRGGTGKGQTDGSIRGRRDGTGREGRGRGRGASTPGNYYPRPPGGLGGPGSVGPYSQGESGDSSAEMGQQSTFNRNRTPFDRQVSGERSWSERNGGGDGGGGGRGRTGGDTNWRRHRGDEDGGNEPNMSGNNNNPGWRPQPKWQHQGRSWRDEDSWTDRDPRMSNHHLPEWAMEKNEGGGSFDASGAFHGHDQEEDIPFKRRDSRHLHQDHQKSKSESSDIGDSGGVLSDSSSERIHEPPEKESIHRSQSSNSDNDSKMIARDDQSSPSFGLDEIKKHVEKLERLKGDEQAMELSEIKRQLELLQKHQEQAAKSQHQQSSVETSPISKDISNQAASQHVQDTQNQQISLQQQSALQVPTSPQPPQSVVNQQSQQSVVHQNVNQPNVLNQQAPSQQVLLNQQVVGPGSLQVQMSQPSQPPTSVPMTQPLSPVPVPQQVHQPLNSLARLHQGPPQSCINDSQLDDSSDNIATDLVAKLMEDEEKRDKQWYYKDPQGQVQGPFSCGEMAEWFQSGYFTLGLMVKRACDPSFSPLGELIKIWGCIPFLADQPGGGNHTMMPPNIQQEKEHSAQQTQQVLNQPQSSPQVQQQSPGQQPPNPPMQDVLMHMKMDQFRQQLIMRQQQQHQAQAAMAGRNQVKMSGDWPDHLPQQDNQGGGGQQASLQLRALLHQMQAHQQMKQQQQSPKVKDGGGSGGGAVMETLMSLHQQQVAQQAALQQLQQAAQLAESQGVSSAQSAGAASIRSLVSQMQQGKLRINPQQPNIDSVWNGGNSWKQWSQVNPKAFKTEQQVLEEQMRAEDERKREEIRKQEEAVRLSEDDTKERKREKQEEKVQNERNKRESDELQRRRMEEEELRRKQEVARRAEVERQRKEEDKRKKEEDKRRKDEEKRKQQEERERLKIEEERKKKEAEEAKKRQDLMSKIQRAQWCPPQASNTSLLDIQRSEREQQVLRSMRDQQAQEAAAAAAAEQAKTNLHLKWTESTRSTPYMAESLAEIQAQQYRQFVKVQEKEKAEREKKEAAAAAANQQVGGTWSQGLNWGALPPQQPVWHSNQGGGPGVVGFWDQLTGPKQPPGNNPGVNKSAPGKPNVVGNPVVQQQQQQQQQHHVKENKSKSKREEMAVMQLFGSLARQDEFTQWCQQTLANLPMSCPFDIPTFVSFLRDIESGPDVLDYVKLYVGESKEATDFARQFLERRHGLSLQQQGVVSQQNIAAQHALSHSNEDFQQVKSKGKNKKKGRVTKMQSVDPRILGFSSTASADRINVGDREYPEDM